MPIQHVIEPLPGFTFGCDPELFIVNGDGEFVGAEGIIPGNKVEPYKVNKGAVQVDGMAAEFNIDPAATYEEFSDNISTVMSQLQRFLPRGHTLAAVPTAVFKKEEFDRMPDYAKELGCMPDYNAWSGNVNPPPHCAENPYLRTASGHLHIGWTNDKEMDDERHIKNATDLVKQMDWYLGAWSVTRDTDNVRRQLYGKAGACRIKPYGVEYRVLSNFWLTHGRERIAVWNRMQQAIIDMRYNFFPDMTSPGFEFNANEAVIRSINDSSLDTTLAKAFNFPIMDIRVK